MEIFELSEQPEKIEKAIDYFWKCWGNDSNFKFYEDCIRNSFDKKKAIPKFYIGIASNEIIGSYALVTNDLISRQDLMPWLACLFVNESYRKRGYAERLLKHGLNQSKIKGFDHLYLSTDLVNFYEKKGWTEYGKGFGVTGDECKIYKHTTI